MLFGRTSRRWTCAEPWRLYAAGADAEEVSDQCTPSRWTRKDDDGFTLIELLIVMVVLGILAAVVVFMLQGVAPKSVRTACAADAKTVGIAAAAYLVENPSVTQVTEADLVAQGTGTLHSWPTGADGAYSIVVAGDGNSLVGQKDASGVTISANDVLVNVGTKYYDASASPPSACASA